MNKVKINFIDILSLTLVLIVVILVIFALTKSTKITGEPVVVTIKITNNANTIYPDAQKLGQAYLDSLNVPSQVTAVSRENPNTIDITLEGKGSIINDQYTFNGIKVLIGQEAEIHGNYFAQGVISAFKYEK